MTYTLNTSKTSPNKYPDRRGKKIKYIVIHHWGDPKNYQAENAVVNVANYLCKPTAKASAHYIATGKKRRVYRIVKESETAWHAGLQSANLESIGIECDPNMTEADLDTVAELIADIWIRNKKKLPLKGHKDIVATACPGKYYKKLADLKKRANVWYAEKTKPAPKPPIITTDTVKVTVDIPYPTVEVETDKLLLGDKVLEQAGADGVSVQEWLVTFTDGVETERKMVSEETVPPIEEVWLIGTYVKPLPPEPEPEPEPETPHNLIECIKNIINTLRGK